MEHKTWQLIILYNLSMAGRATLCAGSQSIKGIWDPGTSLHLNNTIQLLTKLGRIKVFQFKILMGQAQSLSPNKILIKHSLSSYFRVRPACEAYRVPWGSASQEHPILSWIQRAPRWIVSFIYDKLNSEKYMPTPGMKAWRRDISEVGQKLDQGAIWTNVADVKNPNH